LRHPTRKVSSIQRQRALQEVALLLPTHERITDVATQGTKREKAGGLGGGHSTESEENGNKKKLAPQVTRERVIGVRGKLKLITWLGSAKP